MIERQQDLSRLGWSRDVLNERSEEPVLMSAAIEITAAEYARRLRVLLGKGSSGYPSRAKDRSILLRAVAGAFQADETLTEKAFTARIQDFLLGPGRHLGADAVTLRRALVDDGYADRDSNGREYRASRAYERRVRFEAGLPETSTVVGGPRDIHRGR